MDRGRCCLRFGCGRLGGGDYEVVTTNLGPSWGLLVASALLVDYVLTVAVSISSGANYITTIVPHLRGSEVPIAVGLIVFLTLVNLRGTREAGTAFAIPTYTYMFAIALMVIIGFIRLFTGHLPMAASAAYEIQASILIRMRSANRRRSNLKRRSKLPPPEIEKCRNYSATSGQYRGDDDDFYPCAGTPHRGTDGGRYV